MIIKIKEINITLNKKEILDLQKDLSYIVFMREQELSNTGKLLYELDLNNLK